MVVGASLCTQVNYADLQTAAEARYLNILGGFHPKEDDNTPTGCKTLLLLGPHEPDFWPAFTSSSEYADGAPHPMDRWSSRVISAWAKNLDSIALFPFGGPPYLPFFSWGLRTGRIHASPIMLLVHDQAGLFVSFRGALALKQHVDLPTPPANPCNTCNDKPCRFSCPVDAFDGSGYDVPKCKGYLATAEGQDCMSLGCAARRACPVSDKHPRAAAQSAFHMTAFKG